MATEYRCDCCQQVYKVTDQELACNSCRGTLEEWKSYQNKMLADYLSELDKSRAEFFRSRGLDIPASDSRPSTQASVSATSHTKAESEAGTPNKGNGAA